MHNNTCKVSFNIHAKAGSVSSLHLNVSAGPVPVNSTVAVPSLTVTPPLIRWVVQKEGSELISKLLLSIALSSLLLVAATRSTYLPGARAVNVTFPEEPEWWGGGGGGGGMKGGGRISGIQLGVLEQHVSLRKLIRNFSHKLGLAF